MCCVYNISRDCWLQWFLLLGLFTIVFPRIAHYACLPLFSVYYRHFLIFRLLIWSVLIVCFAQDACGGRCASHGGKRPRKRCQVSHGGARRCKVVGCGEFALNVGLCCAHGGGNRCQVVGCDKFSFTGGRCYYHGRGDVLLPWRREKSAPKTVMHDPVVGVFSFGNKDEEGVEYWQWVISNVKVVTGWLDVIMDHITTSRISYP